MQDLVEIPPASVNQPMICRHAGGAPGDRSERPVPGHLQHEEEGDGELTEGTFTTPPPKVEEWNILFFSPPPSKEKKTGAAVTTLPLS